MKNIIYLVITSILLSACSGLGDLVDAEKSNSYFYKSFNKKQIVYSSGGNWFELGVSPLKNVDAKSFQVISKDLAKDKNGVYYRNFLQPQVDVNSFTTFSNGVYVLKDKNHIYHKKGTYTGTLQIIEDADPNSFEYLLFGKSSSVWAKDKNHLYRCHKKYDKNPEEITIYSEYLLSTQDSVYYHKGCTNRTSFPLEKPVEAMGRYSFRIGNTIYYDSPKKGIIKQEFENIKTLKIISAVEVDVNGKRLRYGEFVNE